MHQRKYVLEFILETRLNAVKLDPTPMDTTTKLTYTEYDQHPKETVDSNDEALANQGAYQRLIRKLLYLNRY